MLGDRHYMRQDHRRNSSKQNQSVLKTLIIINVIIYIIHSILGNSFSDFMLLTSNGIHHLQLWRLVSYMFIHDQSSIWHLFFNMYGLYLFGVYLERELGANRFLRLYFISGICGGILWIIFNWHSPIALCGASAGVFGVITATAILHPNMILHLLFPPVTLRLKTLAIGYIGIELFLTITKQSNNIAHLGHIGGAIGGLIALQILFRKDFRIQKFNQIITNWFNKQNHKFRTRNLRVVNKDKTPPTTPITPQEIDRILDKIGSLGMSSLTPQERNILENFRNKYH